MYFIFYSTLLCLPPLRFHCVAGLNPRLLQRLLWQSADTLTARLDLVPYSAKSHQQLAYISSTSPVHPQSDRSHLHSERFVYKRLNLIQKWFRLLLYSSPVSCGYPKPLNIRVSILFRNQLSSVALCFAWQVYCIPYGCFLHSPQFAFMLFRFLTVRIFFVYIWQLQWSYGISALQSVLWIRIRGSVPLSYVSGFRSWSCFFFVSGWQDANKK
jgi:hypothetical protein